MAAATMNPPDSPSESRDSSTTGDEAQVAQATRGTALNLLGAVVAAVMGFVSVIIVTNKFGTAGAGVFFAATALFTLAGNAAKLGAEHSLTYFISRYRQRDQHGSVLAIVTTALTPVAVLSLAFTYLGLFLAPWLTDVLIDDPQYAFDMRRMIRVLALALPTWAMSQAMFGATRGFGTMRPSVFSGQIVRPISQVALVTMVAVLTDSLWLLAVAWGISSVLTLVPVTRWLINRLAQIDAEPTDVGQEFWAYTRPRALSDMLHSALERLDVVLVSAILSASAAGVYGAANRLILAGQMVMIATAQSLAPHLSAGFAAGNHKQAEKLLRTITGWNVTLLWPVFISLAFGAEAILPIFGGDFVEANSLVIVLSLSFLVITFLGMGDTLLLMTGGSTASLVNHIIALVIMLGAAYIMLPTIGVVGAAWAWSLSRIALRALSVGRVWQTDRVHAIGRPVLVAAGICVLAYVPLGVLARVLLGATIPGLILAVAGGVAIHLGFMTIFRKDLELDQFMSVVLKRGS